MSTGHAFDLSGRIALITGAGRGLGWAFARALAGAGATVILNDLDTAAVEARAGELTGARALPFDITDAAAAADAVRRIEAEAGRIDILVNNAGINIRQPLPEQDDESFHKVMEVNLTAAFRLVRLVGPGMMARGHGRIINVASIIAAVARPTIPAYAISKGGIASLTRAAAVELGPHGVTCNAIAPGYIESAATTALTARAEFTDYVARRTPVGRWGRPDDIGPAAVFLASDEAAFVNGHVLTIDGGLTVAV